MRKFLLVLITLSLCHFVTLSLVKANHKCGGYDGGDGVCDQYTEQGACTHGCYSGGDPNPSYHHDTENYADNGPADRQAEIDRALKEAADRAAEAQKLIQNNEAAIHAARNAEIERLKTAVETKVNTVANNANDVKTAINAAGDNQTKIDIARGVGQCDGWADNGSEHRNSGNGCFYTCENGSWKGPSKCDGQGNGLFQYKEVDGKPSQSFLDLSPQQIADEVAKRQWEAYVQTLKQDGKQLVKDDKGEYKKNEDGYITEDIPGYIKVKTTAEIVAETAGQRAAEVTIQQKMAAVEYQAKVAAANRETNETVKNQMLAEYALLYQTVPEAQTALSNLNADLVTKTRERLTKEGKGVIGITPDNRSGSGGATSICKMNDSGGSFLGWIPCDDKQIISDKILIGTSAQFYTLRYGLVLEDVDLKDPTKLKEKLAKVSAAKTDGNKITSSAKLDLVGQDGKSQTLDFEQVAKQQQQYRGAFCGACGGFIADNSKGGCNEQIEAKRKAGRCDDKAPVICKNPDDSLCNIIDGKPVLGTRFNDGKLEVHINSPFGGEWTNDLVKVKVAITGSDASEEDKRFYNTSGINEEIEKEVKRQEQALRNIVSQLSNCDVSKNKDFCDKLKKQYEELSPIIKNNLSAVVAAEDADPVKTAIALGLDQAKANDLKAKVDKALQDANEQQKKLNDKINALLQTPEDEEFILSGLSTTEITIVRETVKKEKEYRANLPKLIEDYQNQLNSFASGNCLVKFEPHCDSIRANLSSAKDKIRSQDFENVKAEIAAITTDKNPTLVVQIFEQLDLSDTQRELANKKIQEYSDKTDRLIGAIDYLATRPEISREVLLQNFTNQEKALVNTEIDKAQIEIKAKEQKLAEVKIDLDLAKQATTGNTTLDQAINLVNQIASGEIKTETVARLAYQQIIAGNSKDPRTGINIFNPIQLRPDFKQTTNISSLLVNDPLSPNNQASLNLTLSLLRTPLSPDIESKLKENYYGDLLQNYYQPTIKSCTWGSSTECGLAKQKIDSLAPQVPDKLRFDLYKSIALTSITNLEVSQSDVDNSLRKIYADARIGDLESQVSKIVLEETKLTPSEWNDYRNLNNNWAFQAYTYGTGQQFAENIQNDIASGKVKPAEVEQRINQVTGADPILLLLTSYEAGRKEYIEKNQKDPGYNPLTKEYWEVQIPSFLKTATTIASTGYNILTQGGAQRNLVSQSVGYEQKRQEYIQKYNVDPGYDPTKLEYWKANTEAWAGGLVNTVPVVTNGVVGLFSEEMANKYVPVTEYQRNSADYVRAGVAFAAPAASIIAPFAAVPFAPLAVPMGLAVTGQTAFTGYATIGSIGNTAEACTFRPDMDRVGCGLAFGNTIYMGSNFISGLARGTITLAEAQLAKQIMLANKTTTFKQAFAIVQSGKSLKAAQLGGQSLTGRIAYSVGSTAGFVTFGGRAILSCADVVKGNDQASLTDCIVSTGMGIASSLRFANIFQPITRISANPLLTKVTGGIGEFADVLDGMASCLPLDAITGNKNTRPFNPFDCALGMYDAFGDNIAGHKTLFSDSTPGNDVIEGPMARLGKAIDSKDELAIRTATAQAISNVGYLEAVKDYKLGKSPTLAQEAFFKALKEYQTADPNSADYTQATDRAVRAMGIMYQEQFLLQRAVASKDGRVKTALVNLAKSTADNYLENLLNLNTVLLATDQDQATQESLNRAQNLLKEQLDSINTRIIALATAAQDNPDFAPAADEQIEELVIEASNLKDTLVAVSTPPATTVTGDSNRSQRFVVRGFGLYELRSDNLYHAMGPSTEDSRKVETQLNQDRIANNTQPLAQLPSLQQPAPAPVVPTDPIGAQFTGAINNLMHPNPFVFAWNLLKPQTQSVPAPQPAQTSNFEYPDTHLGRLLKTLAAKDIPPITITISNHSREAADEAVALGIKAFKQSNETSAQFWERVQREYKEKITQQRNKAPVATMPQTQKIELSLLEKIQSEFDKASIRSNAKKLGIPDTDLKALIAAIDADPKGCFMCSLVVKTQLDKLAKAQNAEAVNGVQEYLKKESELSESTNQDVFRMLVAQANARQNYLAAQPAPAPQTVGRNFVTAVAPHIPLMDKAFGEIGSQALGRFGEFAGQRLERAINVVTQSLARPGLENIENKQDLQIEKIEQTKIPQEIQKVLSEHPSPQTFYEDADSLFKIANRDGELAYILFRSPSDSTENLSVADNHRAQVQEKVLKSFVDALNMFRLFHPSYKPGLIVIETRTSNQTFSYLSYENNKFIFYDSVIKDIESNPISVNAGILHELIHHYFAQLANDQFENLQYEETYPNIVEFIFTDESRKEYFEALNKGGTKYEKHEVDLHKIKPLLIRVAYELFNTNIDPSDFDALWNFYRSLTKTDKIKAVVSIFINFENGTPIAEFDINSPTQPTTPVTVTVDSNPARNASSVADAGGRTLALQNAGKAVGGFVRNVAINSAAIAGPILNNIYTNFVPESQKAGGQIYEVTLGRAIAIGRGLLNGFDVQSIEALTGKTEGQLGRESELLDRTPLTPEILNADYEFIVIKVSNDSYITFKKVNGRWVLAPLASQRGLTILAKIQDLFTQKPIQPAPVSQQSAQSTNTRDLLPNEQPTTPAAPTTSTTVTPQQPTAAQQPLTIISQSPELSNKTTPSQALITTEQTRINNEIDNLKRAINNSSTDQQIQDALNNLSIYHYSTFGELGSVIAQLYPDNFEADMNQVITLAKNKVTNNSLLSQLSKLKSFVSYISYMKTEIIEYSKKFPTTERFLSHAPANPMEVLARGYISSRKSQDERYGNNNFSTGGSGIKDEKAEYHQSYFSLGDTVVKPYDFAHRGIAIVFDSRTILPNAQIMEAGDGYALFDPKYTSKDLEASPGFEIDITTQPFVLLVSEQYRELVQNFAKNPPERWKNIIEGPEIWINTHVVFVGENQRQIESATEVRTKLNKQSTFETPNGVFTLTGELGDTASGVTPYLFEYKRLDESQTKKPIAVVAQPAPLPADAQPEAAASLLAGTRQALQAGGDSNRTLMLQDAGRKAGGFVRNIATNAIPFAKALVEYLDSEPMESTISIPVTDIGSRISDIWNKVTNNLGSFITFAPGILRNETQPAPVTQSQSQEAEPVLGAWNVNQANIPPEIQQITPDLIFDPGLSRQLAPHADYDPKYGQPIQAYRSSHLSALVASGQKIWFTVDLQDMRARNNVSHLNGDWYMRSVLRNILDQLLEDTSLDRLTGDSYVFLHPNPGPIPNIGDIRTYSWVGGQFTDINSEPHRNDNPQPKKFQILPVDRKTFLKRHPEFLSLEKQIDDNLMAFLNHAYTDPVIDNALLDYSHALAHLQPGVYTVYKRDASLFVKITNDVEGSETGDKAIRILAQVDGENITTNRDGASPYIIVPKGQTVTFPANDSSFALRYPDGTIITYRLKFFISSSDFTLVQSDDLLIPHPESINNFNKSRSITSDDTQSQIEEYVKGLPEDDIWLRNIYYNPHTSRGLANLRAAGKTEAEIEALKSHYRSAGINPENGKMTWVWNDQRNVEIINTLSLDPGLMRNIDPDAILKIVNGDTALAAIIEQNLRTIQPVWRLMPKANLPLNVWLDIANKYNKLMADTAKIFTPTHQKILAQVMLERNPVEIRQFILNNILGTTFDAIPAGIQYIDRSLQDIFEEAAVNAIEKTFVTSENKYIASRLNQLENNFNSQEINFVRVSMLDFTGLQSVREARQAVKDLPRTKEVEEVMEAAVVVPSKKPKVEEQTKTSSLGQKLLGLIPSPVIRRNALIAITTAGVVSVAVITAVQGYVLQPAVQSTDQFVPQYVARPDERNVNPIVSPVVVNPLKPTTEPENIYRLSDVPEIKDRIENGCFVKKRLQIEGILVDVITYPNSNPQDLNDYCRQNIKLYDELGPSKITVDQTRLNVFKNVGNMTNLPMIRQLSSTCYLFSSFMGIDILYQQIGEEDGVITMLDPLLVGELTDLTVESFENMYQSSLRDRQMIRTYVVDNNLRDTLIKNPELVETYLNDNRLNDLKSAARFGTVNTQLVSGKKWDNFLLKLGITNRSGGAISISTDDLVNSRQSIKNYVKNNVNPNDVVYLTLVADASGIAHSYIVVGHETKNNKDYLHLIEAHGGDNGPTTWAYYNDIKELKDHSLLLSVDDVIKNFAGFKIMTRTPAGQAMVDNKINSKVVSTQPIETPVIEFSKTLGSIINTYETLNNISELPSAYIVRELAQTQYANVINRPEFKDALKFIDQNTKLIPGQPIQCVGWTALFEASGLGSGIAITSRPGNAIDLIPKSVLSGAKMADAGGRTKAIRIDNLTEINNGDIFVLDNGSKTGHVGKILEIKTTPNGKTFVISEGNKNNDGKISTHEVTEKEFESKMTKLGKVFVLRPYSQDELKAVAMVP